MPHKHVKAQTGSAEISLSSPCPEAFHKCHFDTLAGSSMYIRAQQRLCPGPPHTHITVLSTAEMHWQTRFPQSASYHTLHTACTLCYVESLVNLFVFPSDTPLVFTRHHNVCFSQMAEPSPVLFPPRQRTQGTLLGPWVSEGEVPTQGTQFGVCTNSSSHLQPPHQ